MKKSIIAVVLFLVVAAVTAILLFVKDSGPENYDDISLTKVVLIKNGADNKEGALTNPTKICVDSKENIFVLESDEKCVKKYSGTGSFIKKIGQPGSGPGEIKSCYAMELDDSDNIILHDQGKKTFIRYNNNGDLIDEINLPFFIDRYKYNTGGGLYIEKTKDGTFGKINGHLNLLSSYTSDFAVKNVIDSCRIKSMKQLTNPRVAVERPFHFRMLWGVSKDNIWVALTENYNVKIYSPDGKFIKSFEGKAKKVKVTEKDKKAFFGNLQFTSGEGDGSKMNEAPDWLLKGTEFPDFKPLISDILLDAEGNVLIKTSYEINQKNVWDYYKNDGTLIKNILVPATVKGESAFLSAGYLYAVKETDNGNFTVERYSINRK